MDYPYANGVIKAIESRLLDRSKWSKLAKADKSGFAKALADIGYGRMTANDSLEAAVDREMADFHAMLDEITPDRKLTDLFFLMEDALNLKLLFKRKKFHAPTFTDAQVDGSIRFPGLEKAIRDDDFSELDLRTAALLKRIDAKTEDVDAGRLSALIDQELFAFAFKSLGRFANETMKTYFQAKADFANLIAIFRMRKLGWKPDMFHAIYIPGGKYPLAVLDGVFTATTAEAARLLGSEYSDKVSRIVHDQTEKRSLAVMETALADLLLDLMDAYKNDAFSIGPIVYYHLEKTREADTVRSLYARAASDRPAV